jgi:HK97 family phage major capsid protein
MTILEKVRETRTAIENEIDEILADEARAMSADGIARLAELNTEADEIAQREKVVEEAERRQGIAAEAAAKLPAAPEKKDNDTHVSGEPRVYARNNGQSYFLDLARVQTGHGDPGAASQRLALHGRQVGDEITRRDEDNPFERRGNVRNAYGTPDPAEQRTNPNRTDGQGGYFVPPVWLIDQYVSLFRAGRVFADVVRNLPLPPGTDSINIPKVSTGTAAAIQSADAAGVTSTDMTDTSVSGGVKTIAGQQDIAIQLLDQSPIAFDEVIFQDLIRAYNVALDQQVISGSDGSGQVKGFRTMSGKNAVTYTDASPTGSELYPFLMAAVSQASYAAGGHFDVTQTAFVMHPRRWFWLLGSTDSTGRPIIQTDGASFNAAGVGTSQVANGRVGQVAGIPVYIDANIPTTVSTNQDPIEFVKTDDVFLFESALRTRTLMEVLSGTLQVRVQVYGYLAVIADRLAGAHSEILGTGVAAPAGF